MKRGIKSLLFLSIVACGSVGTGWATTYDLNDYGVSFTIGTTGAVATEFTQAMQPFNSSGTGVITPFLTINAKSTEAGVNTDGTPLPFDDQRPQWNNAITLGNLQSAAYRFALDIDEPKAGDKSILSLDEFKVWVLPKVAGGALVNGNNVDTYTDLADLLALKGGVKAFDLGANNILLHYDLWKGSGQILDMQLEVPSINFSGNSSDSYLYVWAKFSGSDNGGFEEWVLVPANTPIPEPGTFLLLGSGLLGLGFYGRKRMKA